MQRRFTLLLLFISGMLVTGCNNDDGNRLFTRLDEKTTGINFRNTLFEDGPLNVANYIYFYNGGGVAIGDINNDGLQDILFTGNMVRNRLFLNKGNFKFEDITQQSGVDKMQGWCTGATMADVNGDGKLDIYICRSADINPDLRKNLLFINNGDLSFTEKAAEFGLADNGYSTQASFFDYDKDGDLDCFIINHSVQKYTAGVQDNPELRKEKNPDYASKLYRNDNNHFTNVSDSAGITSNVLTFGLGVAISDFNNDGWPDIAVSNDFNEPDYLFMNNRNGTFSEQLTKAMDDISLYSMGSDAADYNNDGLTDLVTLDMLPEDNKTIKMHAGAENFDKFQYLFTQGFYYQYSRNMLQKNNGDGTFSEVGQLAGVSNTDWSWSALFGDYDNDGYKDLFVTNGYVKDYTEMDFLKYSVDRVVRNMHKDSVDPIPEYIRKMPTNETPNYVFQNQGNGTFLKKTTEWGFDQKGVSAGAAYADLDNDGDLDLVINNTNDFAGIYKNNNEKLNKNNYLRVQLNGGAANARGIGAKVKLFCKGQEFYQEQSPVRGFQSSGDPVLNFGVGKNTMIDSLLVIWPNDHFQKLAAVKTNQLLTIKMADAHEKWTYDTVATKKSLSQNILPEVNHKENTFNDFTVQSLLPNYLSRQGPCIVSADVNNDGLDDFFMGGAKGEPAQLFLQNKNNTFSLKATPAFLKDAASEDVAASFFDADNDGDMDLYVASGGFEYNENDPAYQDRLYLNDGKGNFTKKENALPALLASKGCVKAADIDGDGDQDLFVGGRVVPGKYPTSPRSYILLNDGKGNFTDATQQVCAALQYTGMVTDALWMDLNNDHQPDLVVVGEWMPVKVFTNLKGVLSEASAKYIHFKSTGWWNRIDAEDMDGDGDADLVIGNCGTNTQFHVTEKEPMTLYYKDFDNNGSVDPLLCYYIGGVSYPAASRDDLTDQLPGLKKKFLEYKAYSTATINDVFTAEQLKDAIQLKTENMQTVYLENQGQKGFALHQLPIEAQYAPVYGITSLDANHDGKKDLLLAGNNAWTRIKFGRYEANHGVLLYGDGKNDFTYVPQVKSGLNIKGDVRSIVKIKSGNKEQIIVGINNSAALSLMVK
ncbi:VCBS repeat-containing protein [Ferruginibacter paludis]|uniref:VCBS repeat-containing protein n=1 Tax=Ferruginibacter paludis TaxID=1310417 RepID=UPI0025B2AF69|nr:VCBS repeat-containing protein [Ferruginibacter paludis]MDN3657312.1 VCBS repeat-containing protein [Ferruginibacter paludis]